MSENQKHPKMENEAPKSKDGAVVQASSWKKFLAKKWVFPAAYMAAAAIILSLLWSYQGTETDVLSVKDPGLDQTTAQNPTTGGDSTTASPDAVPVTVTPESMIWPVANESEIEVIVPFYDNAASNEEKAAAIIEYDNQMIPSMGLSLVRQDQQSFDVLAALSGTVTRVEEIPVIGKIVEITHENGLKTIYQSVTDVAVEKDQEVAQGDIIAKAGRNELQNELGYHLHFEVHENDQPVNPQPLLTEQQ
jgi:stage II sporulation protein Q